VDDLDKIPMRTREEIVANLFQEITKEEAQQMLDS